MLYRLLEDTMSGYFDSYNEDEQCKIDASNSFKIDYTDLSVWIKKGSIITNIHDRGQCLVITVDGIEFDWCDEIADWLDEGTIEEIECESCTVELFKHELSSSAIDDCTCSIEECVDENGYRAYRCALRDSNGLGLIVSKKFDNFGECLIEFVNFERCAYDAINPNTNGGMRFAVTMNIEVTK